MMDINLLVIDVDGTLTDGGMYYDAQGNEYKRFDTRDGMGISRVRKKGIKVMILTGEDTQIVTHRAEKLQADYCFIGVKNKVAKLEDFFGKYQEFSWETTAYIVEDVNDLDAMQRVAFAASPVDAQPVVQEVSKYHCKAGGGHGAVREFCEVLITGIKL